MLTVFSNISLLIFIKAHADRWETVKIEHFLYGWHHETFLVVSKFSVKFYVFHLAKIKNF